MQLDQPADDFLFEIFILVTFELVAQTSADPLLQFFERSTLPVIFGKLIIEYRQDFLLDLAGNQGKLDRLPGNFLVRMIFWIYHLVVLLTIHFMTCNHYD